MCQLKLNFEFATETSEELRMAVCTLGETLADLNMRFGSESVWGYSSLVSLIEFDAEGLTLNERSTSHSEKLEEIVESVQVMGVNDTVESLATRENLQERLEQLLGLKDKESNDSADSTWSRIPETGRDNPHTDFRQ